MPSASKWIYYPWSPWFISRQTSSLVDYINQDDGLGSFISTFKYLFSLIFAPPTSSSWTHFLHWQLADAWTRYGMFRPMGDQTRVLYQDWLFVHFPGLDYTAPLLGLVLTTRDGLSCTGVGTTQHQVSINRDLCFSRFTFHILQVLWQQPSQWLTAPVSLHLILTISVSHYYLQ